MYRDIHACTIDPSFYLCVCLSVCLSISLSVYLFIYLSIHPSIYLIYLYTYMSVCPSIYIYQTIDVSIYLAMYLSIYLCIYLSICLSIYLNLLSFIYMYISINSSIHLSVYQSIYVWKLRPLQYMSYSEDDLQTHRTWILQKSFHGNTVDLPQGILCLCLMWPCCGSFWMLMQMNVSATNVYVCAYADTLLIFQYTCACTYVYIYIYVI